MRRSILFAGCLLAAAPLATPTALAADFCIGTATELRGAMTQAADNGEADHIRIKAGVYGGPHPVNGSSAFILAPTEDFALRLSGGWVALGPMPCGLRVPDPTDTALRGGDLRTVLTFYGNDSAAAITIENLTIQEGYTASRGAGIDIVGGYAGDLVIDRVMFHANSADGFGAGASLHSDGRVTVRNSVFLRNHCGTGYCALELGGNAVDDTVRLALLGNSFVLNACLEPDSGCSNGTTGVGLFGSSNALVANNNFAFNTEIDLDLAVTQGRVELLHNNLLQLRGAPDRDEGNIAWEDPRFVNLLAFDLRLRDDSPLRDAGTLDHATPPIDFAGAPRVNGHGVDIGAFETQTVLFLDGYE